MQVSQQQNKPKILRRATARQRIIAGIVFLVVAGSLGFFHLAATEKINIHRWINPCGLKQRYGLPCPTCGMTTATLAFARGEIFDSFYIQPAAALLWCIIVVGAFLALLIAVFGVYFVFLDRLFNEVKIGHVFLALIVIIAAGWAVTLARTLAAKAQS